jgi:hypothetical protein
MISLRVASYREDEAEETAIELHYEKACCTEVLRSSNKLKILGAALCPVYETHVALLYNTGKLAFYDLHSGDLFHNKPYRLHSICDHISLGENLEQTHSSLR